MRFEKMLRELPLPVRGEVDGLSQPEGAPRRRVRILAVMHWRRDPLDWQERAR